MSKDPMQHRFTEMQCQNLELSLKREWILPNGIGGFAMGTVAGINTRRYHGLLVAALNPPTDRMMLLPSIEGFAQFGSAKLALSSNQYPGAIHPDGYQHLRSFEQGENYVKWVYRAGLLHVTKTVVVHQGENASTVWYENLGDKPIQLNLRPLVCHRDFHANFNERESYPQSIEFGFDETQIGESGVILSISHPGGTRVPVHGWYYRFEHEREADRGLNPRNDLYCPSEIRFDLSPGQKVSVVLSVGAPLAPVEPLATVPGRYQLSGQLESAAAKFLVKTNHRTSILAGYPWFSDWGRDTMISLPGICLSTGRFEDARQILRDYASQMVHGLIPNRFVEKGEKADHNTVDATLWFGNAIYKTLIADWDEAFAREMLVTLNAVVAWHVRGTTFGIQVDPADGLLRQGEPGTQLTWMDAKIGDWVVTPRHGKPVEISALWINLLRVGEWLADKLGEPSAEFVKWAKLGEANFDAKFWNAKLGYYLDTVGPDDASLRPNQVLAMSLPFSPCDPEHSKKALEVVDRELWTPFGLRTLSPSDPNYRPKFHGPMNELDSSYHQGTVWPWLMGPYISAFLKVGGSKSEAKMKLSMLRNMLTECGLGGISECYDGDEPHRPGGCPWQAWSVAEMLRIWKDEIDGE